MFNFKIENYRSFKKNDFNFSKINILIGENSSGKSSLMKLLLALKQTMLPPANREINLAFTGEYANLGSYKDSIYYHEEKLPISFSFEFDKNYYPFFIQLLNDDVKDSEESQKKSEDLKKSIHGFNRQPTTITYSLTQELDKHKTIQTTVQNSAIGNLNIIHSEQEIDSEEKLIYGNRCTLEYFDYQLDIKFLFKEIEYLKDGFTSLIVGPSLIPQIESFINKEKELNNDFGTKLSDYEVSPRNIFHRIAFLLVSQNYLKYHLDRIDYVNPINTNPSRVYLYKDERQSSGIKDIEDVVNYFSKSNETSRKELEEFIDVLRKYGIAEGIEVISDTRLPVRELRVKVKDLVSNIMDVGYGVSLQLPIILKAWVSDRKRKNSFLFIEQPEVHLHPKLHAQLVETLISFSSQTNYLIETHSEHIIRKLQVLVKEGKYGLKPEDVTIYYLKREKNKSEVSCHKINESGFLEPSFPSGFFDNSYLLSKELID